ncbi:MAG: FG-GAP-like repeat-containing protein [Ignavibacteria bacterium]|jgi:hypothetical protein
MKIVIILIWIILFVFYKNIFGQNIFSEEKIISDTAFGASCVYSIDIDGDNDLDVVACSYYAGKVMWYENQDGLGNFSDEKLIYEHDVDMIATMMLGVFAIDIDGDNDMDVITANPFGNYHITWFENEDGEGNFSSPRTVVGNEGHTNSVFAADLDGDGDIDILPALGTNEVVWYENIDGKGNFGNKKIISSDVSLTSQFIAGDLDGDEDMDVISASAGDSKIAWYSNIDGKGNFGEQQIITTNVDGLWSIYTSDLDNDSDIDILSLSKYDDKVAWYENTDGKGTFSSQKVISTSADAVGGANTIFAIDLDCDGRNDVLSATQDDDKIAWYRNLGDGSFGDQKIISTNADGASSVYACDLDNDGDIDVLSSSKFDSKIAWYENSTNITSVKNNQTNVPDNFQLYQNYPNPFNPSTTIRFTLPKSEHISLKVYNIAGQEVAELINGFYVTGEHSIQLEAEGLTSGIYFYQMKADGYNETKKMLLLR